MSHIYNKFVRTIPYLCAFIAKQTDITTETFIQKRYYYRKFLINIVKAQFRQFL